jgi:hypothetical protein
MESTFETPIHKTFEKKGGSGNNFLFLQRRCETEFHKAISSTV